MKKYVLLLVCALVLFGCKSFESDKLSESEKITIIDMARYTITKQNRKFITEAEAAEINKKMPEVKILYRGPRKGRMLISWIMKNKTVNFVYSGEFLTDSAMWEMGIARHDCSVSKNKFDPAKKRPKATRADFSDIMSK